MVAGSCRGQRPVIERELHSAGSDGPPVRVGESLISVAVLVENVPADLGDLGESAGVCLLSELGWSGCASLAIADRAGRFSTEFLSPPGGRLEAAAGAVSFDMERSGLFVTGPLDVQDNRVIRITLDDDGGVGSVEVIDRAVAAELDPTIEVPPPR